jgi:CHAT domain-containing protein
MRCWAVDRLAAAAFAALMAASAGGPATALTKEQIQEQCRAKLRPAVQACVKKQVQEKGGPPKKHVEGCRQAQTQPYRTCVADGVAASAPSRPELPKAAEEPAVDLSKLELTRKSAFVAPPRTIADITAILDQEKPDPAKTAEWQKSADAALPADAPWKAYMDRAEARSQLGRYTEAIADARKALELIPDKNGQDAYFIRQALALKMRSAGDPKQALQVAHEMLENTDQPRLRGRQFYARKLLVQLYVSLGELDQAEAQIRQLDRLWKQSHGWPAQVDMFRASWGSQLESAKGIVAQARGRYGEAEEAYRRTQLLMREAMRRSVEWTSAPTELVWESGINSFLSAEGRMKAKQGRLFEAEVDVRRSLLNQLKASGKYTPNSALYIRALAGVLGGQGRHEEAEKLVRTAVDVYDALGVPQDSQVRVAALSHLSGILSFQRRWDEANQVSEQIDAAIKNWSASAAAPHRLRYSSILSLYFSGRTQAGLALAQELVAREQTRVGEAHRDMAMARGLLAIGLSRLRRDSDALAEFRRAIPVLVAASQENPDDDDNDTLAAQDQQVQLVVESYVAQLARNPSPATAIESFQLAEAIRGRSVQKALASSSARAAAADPALADLVRTEQDLEKQINAELGLLNNVLSLPSEKRDDKTVAELRAQVTALRSKRTGIRKEIGQKFPNYASLIDPRPPSVADIKAALKPSETFLSFYFGRQTSFVWAVPKEGAVTFTAIPVKPEEIDGKIKKLREALEPQANTISEIPAFDLALAYELYSSLLKPVEAGWRPAKDLVVVTNGALGLLPLGLLPTEPSAAASDDGLRFSSYRKVAWLARTHAVTMVPSASALRTLRNLPPSSPQREMMIGFGDPYFSEQQAAQATQPEAVQLASAAAATRGVPLVRRNSPQTLGVDNAELALLPRLPDTADELKSIAAALQSDPSKVLHLGAQANEKNVKSLDLTKYKILVFATHGLVPGELNGLHQPALAMSAPNVAGHEGDGLLTMEEILALKLDADWVVLSACNTGAGAGAGAEAASGLGRAFFYAGTRAILVTNWSVHSASARELVTDLFRRQARDSKLSRGEALRQAMMELLDKGSYADARGKPLFAYAHPLFWAPYTIIGDGGAL